MDQSNCLITVILWLEEISVAAVIGGDRMLWKRISWIVIVLIIEAFGANFYIVQAKPHRILLDTDVNIDDLFALFYLLKLNRSEFKLEVNYFPALLFLTKAVLL